MIVSIIFDEGRCIITWANFRTDYGLVGQLQILLPPGTPIMIADATLPPTILDDLKKTLHFRKSDLLVFRESCDRPDISILVRPVLSTLSSFRDLDFTLCDWKDGDAPPPKFLIFFDSINDSVNATKHLKSLLPKQYHDKVNWYHSEMSPTYKIEEYEEYVKGETWGLCATDSFGMVSARFNTTSWRLTQDHGRGWMSRTFGWLSSGDWRATPQHCGNGWVERVEIVEPMWRLQVSFW